MRNLFLLFTVLSCSLSGFGQTPEMHYIKFLHVGEKLAAVNTLNISDHDGTIPKDQVEVILDSLHIKTVVTDEQSYKAVIDYVNKTHIPYTLKAGRLDFGTFKVVTEKERFYLPYYACSTYFKNMVLYLQKKKSDPALIDAITKNYPVFFN